MARPTGTATPADPVPRPALIERYLTHVRVERRLAARTVDIYA